LGSAADIYGIGKTMQSLLDLVYSEIRLPDLRFDTAEDDALHLSKQALLA